MKALAYLMVTTWKNRLLQLKRHPGQLAVTLLFAALLVLVILSSIFGAPEDPAELRPLSELMALVFALYFITFLLGSFNGFHSGANFYSMPDVNLLFGSPIAPRTVLKYGLVRQMGTSLMVGFFLLFQYSWMHSLYNIGLWQMIAILVGYGAVVFCSQLTALTLYSCFSGKDNDGPWSAKSWTKRLVLLVSAGIVAAIGLPAVQSQDLLTSLVSSVGRTWVNFVPVAGWAKAAIAPLMDYTTGGWEQILAGVAGIALFIVLMISVATRSSDDFYEDVLKATEVSFSAITASKEGKVAETAPANVKVGRTGIGRGWGAGVFFYKHRLESRRSRIFLLDTMSLVFALMTIAFSFFMREEGLLPVYFFSIYMLLFSSGASRWARELLLPYVYMLPVSPFVKLLHLCRESVLKLCYESVIILIPVGIIMGANPLDILLCIAGRIAFGILAMAGTLLTERLLGGLVNKTFILILYFLLMVLMAVPGLVLGVALSFLLPLVPEFLSIVLFSSLCNLLLAALFMFLSRNVLNYAELNNR